MHIYLIRHTQVGVPAGTCYGHSDVPLGDAAADDFADVATRFDLPLAHPYQMYSSPLSRCRRLADYLASKWEPQSLITDPRLMEMHFGDWELSHWEKISRSELAQWREDIGENKVPGGESLRDVYHRSLEFYNELLENDETPGRRVVIVTHGGVVRVLLAAFLGHPLKNSFRLNVDFGGITLVKKTGARFNAAYVNR